MKKEDLEKLIRKSLSGRASETEKKTLEKWYNKMEDEEGYLHKLSETEKRHLENKIFDKIKQNIEYIGHDAKETELYIPLHTDKKSQGSSFLLSKGLKIAAALVIGMLVTYLSFQLVQHQKPMTSHTADYGQILHLILPDSSTVTLNGNTTIAYETNWEKNMPREVFLEGEAYFSVKQTKSKQKFLVHTSEQFNVEVLGTEFLVSNRKIRTQVVLNSGKVHLNYKEKDINKTVKMDPGDLVAFQNNDPTHYILKRVNAEIYSSWKNHKLMLDNTSLRDICFILQENYGLAIEVSQEDLLNQKVSGSIPINDVDTLLKDISAAYGIKINKQNNTINLREF